MCGEVGLVECERERCVSVDVSDGSFEHCTADVGRAGEIIGMVFVQRHDSLPAMRQLLFYSCHGK